MFERADSHLHLFHPGFVDLLPENCRRKDPDELTLYTALAKRANITHGLVVGYEGMTAHAGNNDYIQKVCRDNPWLHPVWFVSDPQALDVARLKQLQQQGFIGLSLYVENAEFCDRLEQLPQACWEMMAENRWLISVNSSGELWRVWEKVLQRAPGLRLIISHLGLPPAQERALSPADARGVMQHVLSLSKFANVHVKVSGMYALAKPNFAFPHRAAWPLVECVLEAYEAKRLLWGSDFSPSLEYLSFDQTWGFLDELPFLTDAQRKQIAGENLLALLRESQTAST